MPRFNPNSYKKQYYSQLKCIFISVTMENVIYLVLKKRFFQCNFCIKAFYLLIFLVCMQCFYLYILWPSSSVYYTLIRKDSLRFLSFIAFLFYAPNRICTLDLFTELSFIFLLSNGGHSKLDSMLVYTTEIVPRL